MNAASAKRRILIVSYWFAPFSTIAAIRASKLAKHLSERGWDVRVLTADATDQDASLQLEIARSSVVYTPWDRVGQRLERLRKTVGSFAGRSDAATAERTPVEQASGPATKKKRSFIRRALSDGYLELIEWPDNRAGWNKHALAAGMEIIKDWRPDVIYATAPPATALIVADRLSRRTGIPWVAEMRDLWTDHPYYERSRLRLAVERVWDRLVLSRADAIVTVSPGWEKRLRERYRRPVVVAMNGFVAEDFPAAPPPAPRTDGPLRILFTGHIYTGYRDPSPLFEAVRRLQLNASDILIEFVGSKAKVVGEFADRFGLADVVRVHAAVPYRRALELQREADVLLHMQWCDPKENGTIAGKIFDYLGARRPILGIALEDCVVADLVNARSAGLVTNDPAKIAERIKSWLAQKRRTGIPALLPGASQGLDRSAQFEKIDRLLVDVAAGRNSH